VLDGKRTHHLHVLRSGSPEIDDYRLFRDVLRSDRALATEYERLKLALAAEYTADRTRYVIETASWVGCRCLSAEASESARTAAATLAANRSPPSVPSPPGYRLTGSQPPGR
jgi:hypothetical protein